MTHWIASRLTLQPARSHGPIKFAGDDVSTNLIGPYGHVTLLAG